MDGFHRVTFASLYMTQFAKETLPISLEEEMRRSYLDYAMSVIVGRALPDARDGLKPSQRRILFAMNELGVQPNRKHLKCAKIVGETMGNYHPHGDQAIYPTLVHMAQPWAMREMLIRGQGNFGSVEGVPRASMRYTEAKLAPLGAVLMDDMEKGTVDFVPNYDDTRSEPTVLPSAFPNLLVNGGLASLYVTEFLRTQCGLQLAGFQAKHSAPLFCDDELTLLANPVDAQNWEVKICNAHHALAVSIEARINA